MPVIHCDEECFARQALPSSRGVTPIHRYFEGHAAEQPTEVAVTFEDRRLTYGELNCRANQLAHYLVAAGVTAESRVAVCLRPSVEVVVGLLAILKAGGVYMPLDPGDPAERLATILQDNQPEMILTETLHADNFPFTYASKLFCFERDWTSVLGHSGENLAGGIDLEQTAYLFYTSGTTGKPKGVMASHGNLLHYILSAREQYGLNKLDIMPAIARFTFSISLFELLSPLISGGTVLILKRDHVLDFKRMLEVLDHVTVIHASPSWWRKFFAYSLVANFDDRNFYRLRHASAGGDSVPGDLLEKMKRLFPGAEIFVIYGCTEISCMGCTYTALRDRHTTKTWLGRPFPDVEILLLDSARKRVPHGAEGELYVTGPGVTKGYLNRPDLTREKFVTLGNRRFYRTGDLGRLAENNFEILGRVDFQIQLRGIRIEPGEIETHLRQAPAVRDAVVVARETTHGEKSLVAYVVLEGGEEGDIERIRHFLKGKLPDYMVPALFVVLDAIPVNSNQKVDRSALPPPMNGNVAKVSSVIPPRDEWERELAAMWEQTLGLSPIGIRNSFFDLGGDSLQAVQILMQIEERWNCVLPITIMLEATTIEALAVRIRGGSQERKAEEPFSASVIRLRKGVKPPLFCLQGVLLYKAFAQSIESDRSVYGVFLPEEVDLIKTGKYDPINSSFATIPRIAGRYLQSIRSVQPHGPYHLAGFSFAGLIAFEIAQRLRAEGEDVALVAMFDSMMIRKISLRRRLQCHWDLFSAQGWTYLRKKAEHRVRGLYRKLTGDIPDGQIHLPPDPAAQVGVEIQQDILDEVSIRAARSYVPQPYFGKLVLFRATDQAFFSEDSPDLGWTPYAGQKLEIHHIPGNHMGILKRPSVSILARHLESCLA